MGVHLEGSMLVIAPHGLRDLGQGRQQAAVYEGHNALDVFELRRGVEGRQLIHQLANDPTQQVGIKHPGRLGQRPQRGAWAAQNALHLLQHAGLLDAAEAGDDGIEEVQ